jgi:lipopolysaccharide/colanic/teichoic acid biosynthesis glycosyltransferase
MGRAAIFEYQNIIYIPPYFNNLKENIYFKLFIRFFDILVVFILSPFAIIILFFSILTLYIKSGTPIFFTQKRIGKNGLTFTIFKLRTMNLNNSNDFTIINDNRIFPLGKFFRKYKIDEIPQLINILLGHMSIFGPRPERLDLHLIIINKYPEFQKRLLVRPGLTGWAQIKNPLATPNDSFEKLKYDIYFIKNISIKMILNIIISTINILINKKSL